ncbi:MAG: hypothetical protein KatS3mg019_1370 [Fimbriimonadales bacterium]|nr:MAG: hypothetical protein KatS3mg019_1370 [Fimbriimonadales bacterium]
MNKLNSLRRGFTLINFVDGHAKWYRRNAQIPGRSLTSNGEVDTYTLPCDLSGIPGGTPNT